MAQEEMLYQSWLAAYHARRTLSGSSGRLQILYPGQLNRQAGPDFRGARFRWNGVVYQGDVEMHCDAADWYRHGHHFDPAYQNVLLHLVSGFKKGVHPVRHELAQREIPTFFLEDTLPGGMVSCPLPEIPENFYERLQYLSQLRFSQLIRYWQNELNRLSYENVLYQGLMKVSGYAHNQAPFRELAGRLPWELLQSLRSRFYYSPDDLLSLFLFQSGLPGLTRDIYIRGESVSKALGLPGNKISGWQFSGRPANHPLPRLTHLAAWLGAQDVQIWNVLSRLVRQRKEYSWLSREAYNCFRVQRVVCPGSRLQGNPDAPVFLWGGQRFREFMVNILLPVEAAAAGLSPGSGYEIYLSQAFAYFSRQTMYSSYSAVLNWLKNPALKRGRLPVQGIIYLYREYCQQQSCQVCPLSAHFPAGNQAEN